MPEPIFDIFEKIEKIDYVENYILKKYFGYNSSFAGSYGIFVGAVKKSVFDSIFLLGQTLKNPKFENLNPFMLTFEPI